MHGCKSAESPNLQLIGSVFFILAALLILYFKTNFQRSEDMHIYSSRQLPGCHGVCGNAFRLILHITTL